MRLTGITERRGISHDEERTSLISVSDSRSGHREVPTSMELKDHVETHFRTLHSVHFFAFDGGTEY